MIHWQLSAADQTCWLDWIMKCDGGDHYGTSVWFIEWLSITRVVWLRYYWLIWWIAGVYAAHCLKCWRGHDLGKIGSLWQPYFVSPSNNLCTTFRRKSAETWRDSWSPSSSGRQRTVRMPFKPCSTPSFKISCRSPDIARKIWRHTKSCHKFPMCPVILSLVVDSLSYFVIKRDYFCCG